MAHRSDASDSIGRTLALTTELDISDTPQPEKGEERALIMYVLTTFDEANNQRSRSGYSSRSICPKRLRSRHRRSVFPSTSRGP
jgi:hypothetical protein